MRFLKSRDCHSAPGKDVMDSTHSGFKISLCIFFCVSEKTLSEHSLVNTNALHGVQNSAQVTLTVSPENGEHYKVKAFLTAAAASLPATHLKTRSQ